MTSATKRRHAETVPIERLILLVTAFFLAIVALGVFLVVRQVAELLP